MKRVYPVVVERGAGRLGAYAPEVPGSFVVAQNLREVRRKVREAIATHLRLVDDLGDEMPPPNPKVARLLARVTDPESGLPRDPRTQIITVEIDRGETPADRRSLPPAATDASRNTRTDTFAAVLEKGPRNWSGYVPDLPGCVSTGKTRGILLRNMHEAIGFHAQSMVDDGDPFPETRISPEEALKQHFESPYRDPTDPDDDAAVAEAVTVALLPPRPLARVLKGIVHEAHRVQAEFEKECATRIPVGPGESWRGAYAADIFRMDDLWFGGVSELYRCYAFGSTRDELREDLGDAIADHLLEALSRDGTIPLPRHTAEQALARHHLDMAGYGDDLIPNPAMTVEMIPVEIVAPAVACAS